MGGSRLSRARSRFQYRGVDASGKPLRAIRYRELDLKLSWESFDIAHELTTIRYPEVCG
jgi:hypothetical protein